VARSSAPRGFSSEPSSIATAGGFFPLSGLCGLHSSPGAAAVLCLPPWWRRQQWRRVCCAFLAAEVVGGRSISVLERINPSLLRRRGVPLSLQVVGWWSKYDCLHNTGCLERRSSQAVLRGSRLRLEETGSTILIVSWSTRRAFSCPHRALKAP
jgi:hypothetical protein